MLHLDYFKSSAGMNLIFLCIAEKDKYVGANSEQAKPAIEVERSFHFTIGLLIVLILTILVVILYWNKATVSAFSIYSFPSNPTGKLIILRIK